MRTIITLCCMINAVFVATATEWNNRGFFVENKGQIIDQYHKPNNGVLFLLQNASMKVYLTNKGFSYEIRKPLENQKNGRIKKADTDCNESGGNKIQFNSYRTDITFLNSNHDFTVETSGELKSDDIYYNHSLPSKEFIKAKRYAKVVYKNIYKGVDIQFSTDAEGAFKYDIILHDGADLSKIHYAFNGAALKSDRNGGLLICTPLGEIKETIPLSYTTDASGKTKEVDIRFIIKGKNTVSFTSSSDLSGKQLLIDPSPVLQWATYYGADNMDLINAITSDKQGNVIAVGQTMSNNNIATVGSHLATFMGTSDAFVVKFNKAGARQWCTYYGGLNTDRADAVCTDNSGNIYVGGNTYSSNNIVSNGAWQSIYEGPDDAFLAKFDSLGIRQWATYYGGDKHDFIADIATDSSGNVVLTGHSRSNYNISTSGTQQPNLVGIENAFISKFSAAGNLMWGTYLGAEGNDNAGFGIDVDNFNNIYVVGSTQSTTNISTVGTFQPAFAGMMDGFIVKYNSNGNRIWGTYFGEAGIEHIWDIALDSNNNIFVVGDAENNDSIATPGAFQTTMGSFDDAFLQKFNNNGQRVWGTYIGGNSSDYLYGVKCMKNNGNIVIAGYTESDNNIGTHSSYQPIRNGEYDAFSMKFDNNGNRFWGTYFGGQGTEELKTMTLAENNNIIIAGITESISGIATPSAYQTIYGGNFLDGFIAKLCEPLIPVVSSNSPLCMGDSLLLDVGNGFVSYFWNDSSTAQQHHSLPPSSGIFSYMVTTIDTNNCSGESDTAFINVLPLPTVVITQNGNVLSSSFGTTYQWYFNGELISGASNQNYTPIQNGIYIVTISDANGCFASSEPYPFNEVGNPFLLSSDNEIKIYPNPVNKALFISFNHKKKESNVHFIIYNAMGQIVYSDNSLSIIKIISVKDFPDGMYYLNIIEDVLIFNSKFVVMKN